MSPRQAPQYMALGPFGSPATARQPTSSTAARSIMLPGAMIAGGTAEPSGAASCAAAANAAAAVVVVEVEVVLLLLLLLLLLITGEAAGSNSGHAVHLKPPPCQYIAFNLFQYMYNQPAWA